MQSGKESVVPCHHSTDGIPCLSRRFIWGFLVFSSHPKYPCGEEGVIPSVLRLRLYGVSGGGTVDDGEGRWWGGIERYFRD